MGWLAISSLQTICPTLIFFSVSFGQWSTCLGLEEWVRCEGSAQVVPGSVSWRLQPALLLKENVLWEWWLRVVDTFQRLGAQMWPISFNATKDYWGSVSFFLTGLKQHQSRGWPGRILRSTLSIRLQTLSPSHFLYHLILYCIFFLI